MYRFCTTGIAAAAAGLLATGQAWPQVKNRDNSLDMRPALTRQGDRLTDTAAPNAPAADRAAADRAAADRAAADRLRNALPDNCNTGIATDRSVACAAPSRVTTPLPSVPAVPCTPKTAVLNPALGPLPSTCR